MCYRNRFWVFCCFVLAVCVGCGGGGNSGTGAKKAYPAPLAANSPSGSLGSIVDGVAAFNGLFLDDGFSITVLTNYPVQESTPLLNFGETLIQAICNNSTTAGSC